MKIKILSDEIKSKIAAGEIADRPSSIVKELVENSLDAGATVISIELENAGLDLIRVVDNGAGMSSEDLSMCYLPFATSKIFTESDLHEIRTYGFRGEALSSISAVSDFEIKTKTASSNKGNCVRISFGSYKDIRVAPMNTGTAVQITGLYSNLPARKRFMKDIAYEFQRVLDTIIAYSLCNNQTQFSLSHNGKTVFKVRSTDETERIKEILGIEIFSKMLPISVTDEHVSITGFISKPQIAQKSTSNSYVFVNSRPVQLKTILSTVTKSYGSLIPHGLFPPLVLNIKLSPNLVDVNVHPQKHEVRFWDDAYVLNILQKAIVNALNSADLTYVLGDSAVDFNYPKKALDTYAVLKDSVSQWSPTKVETGLYSETLQIDKTYIATETEKGLLLVDQHAAHESILYEEFYTSYIEKTKNPVSVNLPEPLVLSFSVSDAAVLRNYLDDFNSLGFMLLEFGSNDFRLESLPEFIDVKNISAFIKDFISDVSSDLKIISQDTKILRTLAFLACRAAVKAGDYLSHDERKNIFIKLDQSKNLYTCPHGRPLKIVIKSSELARMFKRLK